MPDDYQPDYYAQGELAAQAGQTVDDNPHREGSPEAWRWLCGYMGKLGRMQRGE